MAVFAFAEPSPENGSGSGHVLGHGEILSAPPPASRDQRVSTCWVVGKCCQHHQMIGESMCDRLEFGEADTWLLRGTKETCLTVLRPELRDQCAPSAG